LKEVRINYKDLIELQKQGEEKVYKVLQQMGFDLNKPIDNYDNVSERYRVFIQKD
jgi:hypothetical protein